MIADAQGQGTILNDDPVPRMSIDDVRVVEGNAGPAERDLHGHALEPERRCGPASWSTSNGTAVAPGDYATNSGTVSFAPGRRPRRRSPCRWPATSLPEGERDVPGRPGVAGGRRCSGRAAGIGTILDDDGAANPDVGAFTIVSDGATGATSGRNRLQWVNPVGGNPIEMRIRFNKGIGCAPPDPALPNTRGLRPDLARLRAGLPESRASFDHAGLDLDTSYCYTFWVIHTGPVRFGRRVRRSAGRSTPTGNLKWKYATSTATTGVAPPTVGIEGILAVDNSGDVHAMRRSATGGAVADRARRPGTRSTSASPSQARNPISPSERSARAPSSATQDGRVHAGGRASGALHWSTPLSPAAVTGAPAGIFTAFGGEHDAVFAGTSAADDNVFHALDPATGTPLTSFGFPADPGIGPILGMAAVDYSRSPQNRVYFASRQGTAPQTLWCLELGPAGPARLHAALEGGRSAKSAAARCCATAASTWARTRAR